LAAGGLSHRNHPRRALLDLSSPAWAITETASGSRADHQSKFGKLVCIGVPSVFVESDSGLRSSKSLSFLFSVSISTTESLYPFSTHKEFSN
jgi:hypothetical protein